MKNYVYSFGGGTADGDGKMKEILGGKGAGLAEMSKAGVPVPPGFTISTEVCNIYFENGNSVPEEINQQVLKALAKLESQIGKKLGDPSNPLLVSVRSGAKFSMPGMMNTILNLGINDETVAGLAAKTGNEWFALDCYRRFLQMFGEVAVDIHMEKFNHVFDAQKAKSINLVHEVVPLADLDTTVQKFITEALSASPTAVARAKALLDEAGYPDPDGDGPRTRFALTLKVSNVEYNRAQSAVM